MQTKQAQIKTSDMSRDEWLLERKKGIGGSDVSAILGVNKYKTAFEVWREKQPDYIPEEITSEAAEHGTKLEPYVADLFQDRTGKKVRKKNFIIQHPEHSFMLANIDRAVVGENAILECKTANQFLLKEWEADEVPDAYLVQCQHYMNVLNKEKCYIAVLVGGQRFIWKEIERDQELINIINERLIAFWNNYVIPRVPPALDGSSAAEKYLNSRFSEAEKGTTINLGKSDKTLIEEHLQLKDQSKQLSERIKKIENQLKYEMQSAETAYVGDYEVSWKNVTSSRLDTKKLKREKPGLAEGFMIESTSRRFTIKTL